MSQNNLLENGLCKHDFSLECLGVRICIESNSVALLRKIKEALPSILPIEWKNISRTEIEHNFSVIKSKGDKKEYSIYKDSELVSGQSAEDILSQVETQMRSTVAEFARDRIFLHAGAVSRNGKAIIIPGRSFSGKTTLVAELVKRGCEYLSDEYAVIDKYGMVHPFPKKLSIRGIIDDIRQVDFEVEELGGRRLEFPVPVGYLLLTAFNKELTAPEIIRVSEGDGVMAGVANSISVRQNPKFVLEVLGAAARSAVVLQSERGEVREFAEFLLNYLEEFERP